MNVFSKTVDGIEMNPWDLDSRIVTVECIGRVLARINRYAGHWVNPISVARHCLTLARNLELDGHTPMVQLQGLMHDATEAYTQDIPSPLKSCLLIELPATTEQLASNFPSVRNSVSYAEFENDFLGRIFERLMIQWPIHPAVWREDTAAYNEEIHVIQGYQRGAANDPSMVERLFINRAYSLMSLCGIKVP